LGGPAKADQASQSRSAALHLQQIDALNAARAEIESKAAAGFIPLRGGPAAALAERHHMPHHERREQRVHLIGDRLPLVFSHARERHGRD